jgi:Ca2+/Na+ antiporter
MTPPVFPKKGTRRYFSLPDLELLGRGIGFNDPTMLETLALHQQRLKSRAKAAVLIGILFALPFAIGLIWLMDHYLDPNTSIAISFVVLIGLYLVFILYAVSIIKILVMLLDGSYADTLCIFAVISLIIELSRDDVLVHPARKRALLVRMNDLARSTLRLPLAFGSKGEMTKTWLREHFRHMESYVRERERWAIAPKDTTLEDMRQDFYRLASVYITGNYGDFAWAERDGEARVQETSRRSPTRRLLSGLPRFIVGIVLPLVGLALIFVLEEESIQRLGMKEEILALIFFAWFLLAVDSMLNLGIVAGVADLAKGMKELT